jgi:hypothetical protein
MNLGTVLLIVVVSLGLGVGADQYYMSSHPAACFSGQKSPTKTREELVKDYINSFNKFSTEDRIEAQIGSIKLLAPICDGLREVKPDQLENTASWNAFFNTHKTEISELDNATYQKVIDEVLSSSISNNSLQMLSDFYSSPAGKELKHLDDQIFFNSLWQGEVTQAQFTALYLKSLQTSVPSPSPKTEASPSK